jgi:hypothetical protein
MMQQTKEESIPTTLPHNKIGLKTIRKDNNDLSQKKKTTMINILF